MGKCDFQVGGLQRGWLEGKGLQNLWSRSFSIGTGVEQCFSGNPGSLSPGHLMPESKQVFKK